MKSTIIMPLIIGLVLGAGATYLAMREPRSTSNVVQVNVEHEAPSAHKIPLTDSADPFAPSAHKNPVSDSVDPFASGEADSSNPPGYDGNGLILTDPNSVQQRHMCIAAWYEEYSVENFGRHTGHEFGPVWNRRNPIMILEEQLEFMKEFMAETDRLEMEQFPQNRDRIKRRLLRESATDPRDKALIDWRDYFGNDFPSDENGNWSWMVWYGKSMKTKRWLAYDDDKGVFEPCEELLQNIIWCEKSMSEMPDAAHPFSNKQK